MPSHCLQPSEEKNDIPDTASRLANVICGGNGRALRKPFVFMRERELIKALYEEKFSLCSEGRGKLLVLDLGMTTLQSRHRHMWHHPRKLHKTSLSSKASKVYLGENNPQYQVASQSLSSNRKQGSKKQRL